VPTVDPDVVDRYCNYCFNSSIFPHVALKKLCVVGVAAVTAPRFYRATAA